MTNWYQQSHYRKNYLIGLRFYIEIQQSSYDVSNEEVAADCDNLETLQQHLIFTTVP